MSNKISITEARLFAEAWLWLAIARLILICFPFRKITPLLGKNITGKTQPSVITHQSDIGIAISRACRRSPWRTECFEQALAAKIMLKIRGTASIIYFGLHKNEILLAHAWLESNGVIITGGKNTHPFTIVASFQS